MPLPPRRRSSRTTRRDGAPPGRSFLRPRPLSGRSIATLTTAVLLGGSLLSGCRRDRDMANRVEMPDTTTVMRAMESEAARDSMLDTLPGGEMARGDSAMEMKLLKDKM